MTRMVALDEDYHVHSVFSDGVSTVDENVAVARDRGLRTLCLADHVRAGTGWVADFVRAVWPLRALAGIEILAGVETKILDRSGRLDLPASIDGIDLVLIADHQFPGDTGPVHPQAMREALESGQASAPDVISCLVEATANALPARRRGALPQRPLSRTCSACCRKWGWPSRRFPTNCSACSRTGPAGPARSSR